MVDNMFFFFEMKQTRRLLLHFHRHVNEKAPMLLHRRLPGLCKRYSVEEGFTAPDEISCVTTAC